MATLPLNKPLFDALSKEACRVFPNEACGVILGASDAPGSWVVHPLENIQDRLHKNEPTRFTRDATTAYAMNPLKVQRLIDAAIDRGEALIAIFHSHPNHPSYFSETDKQAAMPFGTPTFPDAYQLVVSVYDGTTHDLKAFKWQSDTWTEAHVTGLPALPGPPPGARALGDV